MISNYVLFDRETFRWDPLIKGQHNAPQHLRERRNGEKGSGHMQTGTDVRVEVSFDVARHLVCVGGEDVMGHGAGVFNMASCGVVGGTYRGDLQGIQDRDYMVFCFIELNGKFTGGLIVMVDLM